MLINLVKASIARAARNADLRAQQEHDQVDLKDRRGVGRQIQRDTAPERSRGTVIEVEQALFNRSSIRGRWRSIQPRRNGMRPKIRAAAETTGQTPSHR